MNKEKFIIHIEDCLNYCIKAANEGDLSAVEDMASGISEKIRYYQIDQRFKELEGRLKYLER